MEKAEMNLFEQPARGKFRFPYRGDCSVEDLFDLSVESLDVIYKELNAKLKAVAEDSLLATKSKADAELAAKVEIIKYIVASKQADAVARKDARDRLATKKRLLGLKADAEDAALRSKTPEQLQEMIDALN